MEKTELQAKFAERLKTRDEDLAEVLIPEVEAWLEQSTPAGDMDW